MICAACGHSNSDGNKFCGMCGAPQPRVTRGAQDISARPSAVPNAADKPLSRAPEQPQAVEGARNLQPRRELNIDAVRNIPPRKDAPPPAYTQTPARDFSTSPRTVVPPVSVPGQAVSSGAASRDSLARNLDPMPPYERAPNPPRNRFP